MEVHILLKSLNNIDEEMIAEADRFVTEQSLHRKGKWQYFWTGISAAAAVIVAVSGIFFFSLQPGHSPANKPDGNIVATTQENTSKSNEQNETQTASTKAAEESLSIAVAAADYTQDMVDYIESVSKEWIQPVESYRENVQNTQEQKNQEQKNQEQNTRESESEFIVMEPFQTWNRTPSKETLSDGYILPIICDDQVICTVSLYQLENSWHYSISDDLCEELTALINSNKQVKITYCFDAKGNYTQTDVLYENGEDNTVRNIGVLMMLTADDATITQ